MIIVWWSNLSRILVNGML